MILPSEHYFVDYFKFQSQHFFKIVSRLNGKPEIKGKKALDLFSHFIGHKSYDTAVFELKRIGEDSEKKSSFAKNVDKSRVLKVVDQLSIEKHLVDTLIDGYYWNNYDWYADAAARSTLASSLRRLNCISFYYKDSINYEDGLAHDLFKLGEILSGEYWNDIYRNQLVGALRTLGVLFRSNIIKSYNFQDVADCMALENYKFLNWYFNHFIENLVWDQAPNTEDVYKISDCFDKVMRHYEKDGADVSYARYRKMFSDLLRQEIRLPHDRATLVDLLALNVMNLTGQRLQVPHLHYQKLLKLGLIAEPNALKIPAAVKFGDGDAKATKLLNNAFSWQEKITAAGRDLMNSRFN